jgi:anthranilate synthase/indole-3-glycerol phosphate synthase/phosphoribosylanthranilate isomerase
MGVCMGLQCIYAAYGGDVDAAGEVIHGKTSAVMHDGKGLFLNVDQGVQCTRYHSLAGNLGSLPDDLVVTSRTKEGVEGERGGIVMGIRHKTYAMEAVQYHPESILSEQGKVLLANFLSLRGGLWSDNPHHNVSAAQPNGLPAGKGALSQPAVATILTKIANQRTLDIAQAKSTHGSKPADLSSILALNASFPVLNLHARLKQQRSDQQADKPHVALMAEVKRASPSKGDILPPDSPLSSAGIALSYALAGASVISVLTEPKWFKGSLEDMRAVRTTMDSLPNRPAVLRKDFILDTYQIDEARVYGADTVLLIVAMLDDHTLKLLYDYSMSQGMEPLVEVNNGPELDRALKLGARVIGVNNRNLHDFNVDMSTSSKMADLIKARRGDQGADEVILCALSGISSGADVVQYVEQGIGAVLVGEALMRASDKAAFVQELLGLPQMRTVDDSKAKPASPPDGISSDDLSHRIDVSARSTPLVKICGVQTVEAAQAAADAGTDMIGLNFVTKSKSYVDRQQAADIVAGLRKKQPSAAALSATSSVQDWFGFQTSRLASRRKPLCVGVFQNHDLSFVLDTVDKVGLDVVQLHGDEPVEWARFIPVPVIKVFHVDAATTSSPAETAALVQAASRPGYHAVSLLDTKVGTGLSGGAGKTFDWEAVSELLDRRHALSGLPRLPVILAGGLNAGNVRAAVDGARPWCVDVSSGVKTDGVSDPEKIAAFVAAAKA